MPSSTDSLRIGLVGCGFISTFYRRALDATPGVTAVVACDIDPSKAQTTSAQGLPFVTDLGECLRNTSLDAVVVNVPNDLHYSVCTQVLEAGVAVCCEKPLTLAPDDAQRLQALADMRGLALFTAFHRRYNRNVLQALAESAGPAAIEALTVYYLEKIEEHCFGDSWYLHPERVGGGCIADNGPNAFDTVASLLGPVQVSGCEIEYNAAGVDIRARVQLVSAEGIPAECLLDWDYPDGEFKGIQAKQRSGDTLSVDFLEGFPAFKSSMDHEYEGIVAAFAASLRGVEQPTGQWLYPPDGAAMVDLVAQAYRVAKSVAHIDTAGLSL